VARQHLTRALEIRTRCHGAQSLKVAETLNSLALVHQAQSDASSAEKLQLQSLQVLFENCEPEDAEGEDVPWEVFKRIKRQRGPSTAANSVVLYKGNLRKAVTDALLKAASDDPDARNGGPIPAGDGQSEAQDERAAASAPRGVDSASNAAVGDLRALRSKSDSAMRVTGDDPGADRDPKNSLLSGRGGPAGRSTRGEHGEPPRQPQLQPIPDFVTLQQRVEHLKRRIAAGLPDSDSEVEQLATDVARISSPELQSVGDAMLSLVRELHRLRVRSDAARQLPVLEGVLEKKSASIFRGWEKRWFKVDPKTFVLSYHFSKDDDARGFAPRGGFAISPASWSTATRAGASSTSTSSLTSARAPTRTGRARTSCAAKTRRRCATGWTRSTTTRRSPRHRRHAHRLGD